MQITVQYIIWNGPRLIRTLIFEVKFEGKKKNVLNYYTRVNTGPKTIKNNKFVNLFFPLLKQHTDYQL